MSDDNPYTPPAHDHDDARRPLVRGGASWDGSTLVVPKQLRFPSVCLKCASPEVHSRRRQKFSFTPIWARMLVLLCWPGALVAMVLTTKRATLELPLCDACFARFRQAKTRGILLGISMVVGILVASFATGTSESAVAGLILPSAILLVGLGVMFGMKKLVRPHLLQAKKIDDAHVTLLGVHPRAGEQVARG